MDLLKAGIGLRILVIVNIVTWLLVLKYPQLIEAALVIFILLTVYFLLLVITYIRLLRLPSRSRARGLYL